MPSTGVTNDASVKRVQTLQERRWEKVEISVLYTLSAVGVDAVKWPHSLTLRAELNFSSRSTRCRLPRILVWI